MFTLEEGAKLVKLARKAIEYFLATGKILADPSPDEKFNVRYGVFV
ncbi:MAG: TIGR00296 family protein, partial [Candidatus Iainarchaeum archaeon]